MSSAVKVINIKGQGSTKALPMNDDEWEAQTLYIAALYHREFRQKRKIKPVIRQEGQS